MRQAPGSMGGPAGGARAVSRLLAALFERSGSAVADAVVAWQSMVSGLAGRSTRVTVAWLPGGREPRSQARASAIEQLPCEALADSSSVRGIAGPASVTEEAASGPRLLIVKVQWAISPTITEGGSD